jgi:hypothetical protein
MEDGNVLSKGDYKYFNTEESTQTYCTDLNLDLLKRDGSLEGVCRR